MTVTSTSYAAPQYSGNGTTTIFAFAYPFFAASDLQVLAFDTGANANVAPQPVLNGAGTYDYVVTGTQDADTGEYIGGGSVVFNTAPPGNFRITILRQVAAEQPVSLPIAGAFPPKTIEAELDRLTMLVQQLIAVVARSLVLNPSDIANSFVMPPAATRASQYLGFDVSGNPTVGSPTNSSLISAAMQAVVDQATLAEAAAAMEVMPLAGGTITGAVTLSAGGTSLIVSGSETIGGSLGVTGAANVGGTLGVSGAASVGGQLAVPAGTLATSATNLAQSTAGATTQTVTGSRALGASYTNTTGRAIFVNVVCNATSVGSNISATVNGAGVEQNWAYAASVPISVNFVVPPGETYVVTSNGGSLSSWVEMR